MELSDTIHSYVQETRQSATDAHSAIEQLQTRLQESINSLAKRQSFKDTM
jgi:hypothetical protein